MLENGALTDDSSRRLTQIENWPQSETTGGGDLGRLRPSPNDRQVQRPQSPDSYWHLSVTSPRTRHRKRKRGERYPLRTSPAVIPHRLGSVWAVYEKCYETQLDGMVTTVQRRDGVPGDVLGVRSITKDNQDRKLRLLSQCQDPALFVRVVEVFVSESMMHIVREDMDVTLMHVLAAPVFPQEAHVAAIAGKASL